MNGSAISHKSIAFLLGPSLLMITLAYLGWTQSVSKSRQEKPMDAAEILKLVRATYRNLHTYHDDGVRMDQFEANIICCTNGQKKKVEAFTGRSVFTTDFIRPDYFRLQNAILYVLLSTPSGTKSQIVREKVEQHAELNAAIP